MPIFMDRHDVPGATAADVAIAHQKDLVVQAKYDCRVLTYWFDEVRAVASCLVEAPDAVAVTQMHREAHGLVPNRIIQVHGELVETFLGRIGDPVTTEITDEHGTQSFVDTAFRTVLAVELKDVAILAVRYGLAVTHELLRAHEAIINDAIQRHRCGRAAKSDDLYLVTSPSASNAVECARQFKRPSTPRIVGDDRTSESTLSVGIGLEHRRTRS